MTGKHIIQQFQLEPHPEGGFYKRTFVSENESFSAILFLLLKDNFSAFHRIQSDEQWNWYRGDDVLIHEIDRDGNYTRTVLSGREESMNFQHVVKAGHWFASECSGEQGFAFCGCTVIPAFRFETFEMGSRDALTQEFPQHKETVRRLTR